MPKLLTKKGQDATDENYFIGGTVERLPLVKNWPESTEKI